MRQGDPPPVLTQIPVGSVVIGERMRQLDEQKVLELMTSFEEVGVINPISVDEDNVLMPEHTAWKQGRI